MAKFYVQSGQFCLIVQAHDGEGAALWAVHQYLAICGGELKAEPIGGLIGTRSSPPIAAALTEAAIVDTAPGGAAISPNAVDASLAATIRCSEIGFGRADRGEFFTTDVLQKYCELLSALEALGK